MDEATDEVIEKPPKSKQTEREKLEQEKIALCKELGIWQTHDPVDGYAETAQFQRISEINKRLSEIVIG